jgi:integrase
MARSHGVHIRRRTRSDGTITYSLRIRVDGFDETIPLGNVAEGWDELRAERTREQVRDKIRLGLWNPGAGSVGDEAGKEPTFVELATEWLLDRERNPEIRQRTTEDDRWRLERYLIPYFGMLRPSQITPFTIKQYRRRIHEENQHIRSRQEVGNPVRDPRTRQPVRTLSNDSINKTLRSLALILDEAEDAGWVSRNAARGRRTREPVQRRRGEILEPDEFVSLLEAAGELDRRQPAVERLTTAEQVRQLRDGEGMQWKQIGAELRIPTSTAFSLYGVQNIPSGNTGPRRAIVSTLGLAGLRVTELCVLAQEHVDLVTNRIYVRDAKTPAGIRTVDIHPRLRAELIRYYQSSALADSIDAPAFPTSRGTHRTKDTIGARVIAPVVRRANELRHRDGRPPIRAHVTPHTFRRTYITFMLAAGFDLPYVQDQVGHLHPTTTLAIYARVIRRPDRDALRVELRSLFNDDESGAAPAAVRLEPRSSAARTHDAREREGFER